MQKPNFDDMFLCHYYYFKLPAGIHCHRVCGRPLQCGIHACRLDCHSGYPDKCESSSESGCDNLCGLPRGCGHGCLQRCHPDQARCPEAPCKVNIIVRCGCGRKSNQAPCLQSKSFGEVPLGLGGLIRLQCDDECEEQRRLTAFAQAIGTNPTSLTALRSVGQTSGGSVAEDGYAIWLLFASYREPLSLFSSCTF